MKLKQMSLSLLAVTLMFGFVSSQLISPISGAAQAPPPGTTLTEFTRLLVAGDYVAAGVGLRGQTSGNIVISGIPEGATVALALLYWGMLDTGESESLNDLNFNGMGIQGTSIGTGPDPCWSVPTGSFAYRADVTSLVSGNGTYQLTGIASGGNILAEGASLVVVYKQFGERFREVVILDGDVVLDANPFSATSTISGFHAAAPVDAKTTYVVGDGQPVEDGIFTDSASFTGGGGTATFTNPFEGSDGPWWDTDRFIVSSQVAPDDINGSVRISIGSDCLMWVAQVFSVTTDPIADLIADIVDFDLSGGTERSLITKLEAALASIDRGNQAAACASLQALINVAAAQSGNHLTEDQANQIIAAATEIKSALNCP